MTLLTFQLEISPLKLDWLNKLFISVTLLTSQRLISPLNLEQRNNYDISVISETSIQLRLQLLPKRRVYLLIAFDNSFISDTLYKLSGKYCNNSLSSSDTVLLI